MGAHAQVVHRLLGLAENVSNVNPKNLLHNEGRGVSVELGVTFGGGHFLPGCAIGNLREFDFDGVFELLLQGGFDGQLGLGILQIRSLALEEAGKGDVENPIFETGQLPLPQLAGPLRVLSCQKLEKIGPFRLNPLQFQSRRVDDRSVDQEAEVFFFEVTTWLRSSVSVGKVPRCPRLSKVISRAQEPSRPLERFALPC